VDKPTLAILLTLGVHALGIGALFWLALGSQLDWRSWWPGDDTDDGDGGSEPYGPPLPGADPARRRIRTAHERLADGRRPSRRPEHAPLPGRTREPV
jgi:hypothetical protein